MPSDLSVMLFLYFFTFGSFSRLCSIEVILTLKLLVCSFWKKDSTVWWWAWYKGRLFTKIFSTKLTRQQKECSATVCIVGDRAGTEGSVHIVCVLGELTSDQLLSDPKRQWPGKLPIVQVCLGGCALMVAPKSAWFSHLKLLVGPWLGFSGMCWSSCSCWSNNFFLHKLKLSVSARPPVAALVIR